MALSATLSELETWVRQDADMQAPDDRVTSSECRNRINRSLAHLYDRLVLVDQEYFLRSVSRTSNQSGKYDIMNDFLTGVVRTIVSVTTPGFGYTDGALVTLSQGTNATATATITVVAGAITAVSLVSSGFGYFDSATPNYISLTVSGGVGGVVLVYIESDFYKCKGIWYSDAGGGTGPTATWFPLRRFQWEQQNALNQSANLGGSGALPLYRIMTENGRDKALLSPDNAGGAFQLWYYPAPTRLLVDNDRFNGRAGWDDWIVKDVAIQLLMAEESIEQAAALKSIRDEIWERIQLHASDREASQPERIMDVTLLSRRYSRR